jgi:hypothetical protein
MMILPHDAPSYAWRVAAALPLLALSWFLIGRPRPRFSPGSTAWGTLAGIAVFFIWIAPEYLGFTTGNAGGVSPFDPEVCGWPLTLVRLAGSTELIGRFTNIAITGATTWSLTGKLTEKD